MRGVENFNLVLQRFFFFKLLLTKFIFLGDLKYSFIMSSVPSITYITGQRGAPKIVYGDYSYVCAKHIKNRKYWICSKQRSRGCKARLITDSDDKLFITRNLDHNHTPDPTYSRKLYKRV